MARSDKAQLVFNSGEVTPLLDGRSDVEKLSGACRSLQNMTTDEAGAAIRRPGLQYIASVRGSTGQIAVYRGSNLIANGATEDFGELGYIEGASFIGDTHTYDDASRDGDAEIRNMRRDGSNVVFTLYGRIQITNPSAGMHIRLGNGISDPLFLTQSGVGINEKTDPTAGRVPGDALIVQFTNDGFGVSSLKEFLAPNIRERTYRIVNEGNSTVTLSSVTVTGQDTQASFYLVDGPDELVLAPGDETTVVVLFQSGAAGSYVDGLLRIVSNGSPSPYDVNLTGSTGT